MKVEPYKMEAHSFEFRVGGIVLGATAFCGTVAIFYKIV